MKHPESDDNRYHSGNKMDKGKWTKTTRTKINDIWYMNKTVSGIAGEGRGGTKAHYSLQFTYSFQLTYIKHCLINTIKHRTNCLEPSVHVIILEFHGGQMNGRGGGAEGPEHCHALFSVPPFSHPLLPSLPHCSTAW